MVPLVSRVCGITLFCSSVSLACILRHGLTSRAEEERAGNAEEEAHREAVARVLAGGAAAKWRPISDAPTGK